MASTTSRFLDRRNGWSVGDHIVEEASSIEEDALLFKKKLSKQRQILAVDLFVLAVNFPHRIAIMLIHLSAAFRYRRGVGVLLLEIPMVTEMGDVGR